MLRSGSSISTNPKHSLFAVVPVHFTHSRHARQKSSSQNSCPGFVAPSSLLRRRAWRRIFSITCTAQDEVIDMCSRHCLSRVSVLHKTCYWWLTHLACNVIDILQRVLRCITGGTPSEQLLGHGQAISGRVGLPGGRHVVLVVKLLDRFNAIPRSHRDGTLLLPPMAHAPWHRA